MSDVDMDSALKRWPRLGQGASAEVARYPGPGLELEEVQPPHELRDVQLLRAVAFACIASTSDEERCRAGAQQPHALTRTPSLRTRVLRTCGAVAHVVLDEGVGAQGGLVLAGGALPQQRLVGLKVYDLRLQPPTARERAQRNTQTTQQRLRCTAVRHSRAD